MRLTPQSHKVWAAERDSSKKSEAGFCWLRQQCVR